MTKTSEAKTCKCGKPITTLALVRQNKCRECFDGYVKLWRKENPWAEHLRHARVRCTNPKNNKFKRYGGRGIKCNLTLDDARYLWFRDHASILKRPSIDRINNDGDYELINCRFIELSENGRKGNSKLEAKSND